MKELILDVLGISTIWFAFCGLWNHIEWSEYNKERRRRRLIMRERAHFEVRMIRDCIQIPM